MTTTKKSNHKQEALRERLGKYLESGPQMIPVTNRYPIDTLSSGKAIAKKLGITFNRFVVILLKDAVSQDEKK